MAATAELVLLLKAKDDASRVVKEARGEIEQYGVSANRILKPAILAVAAAGAVAVGAIVNFTKAAADEEAANARLAQSIRNTGVAVGDRLPDDVERGVVALQHMAGFGRNEVADALAILVAETGNYQEALVRERLAVDFARGANIDLYTASKLLGKVTDENVNVLARYGIHVAKGTSETELFGLVAQKFGGQAAAFGKTAEGQWAILGQRIQDLRAEFGRAFLPVVTLVVARLSEFLQRLVENGTIERFTEALRSLAGGFIDVLDRVGAFFSQIQTVGLGEAIKNLLFDIVANVKEKLPEIGAKLDELGPIGMIIKIALLGSAVNLGLGFAAALFGNILGAIVGVSRVFGLGSAVAGASITATLGAGIILGIALEELLPDQMRTSLQAFLSSKGWWAGIFGVPITFMAVALGASPMLVVSLVALFTVTALVSLTQKEGQSEAAKTLADKNFWIRALGLTGALAAGLALGLGAAPELVIGLGLLAVVTMTISLVNGGGGGNSFAVQAQACAASGGLWDSNHQVCVFPGGAPVPKKPGDTGGPGKGGTPGENGQGGSGGIPPQPSCADGYHPFYDGVSNSWSCVPNGGGGGGLLAFDQGGIVPGPQGAPQLAIVHGAETVTPPGAGGTVLSMTLENHYHGAVIGLEEVERFVRETMRDAIATGAFRGLRLG